MEYSSNHADGYLTKCREDRYFEAPRVHSRGVPDRSNEKIYLGVFARTGQLRKIRNGVPQVRVRSLDANLGSPRIQIVNQVLEIKLHPQLHFARPDRRGSDLSKIIIAK